MHNNFENIHNLIYCFTFYYILIYNSKYASLALDFLFIFKSAVSKETVDKIQNLPPSYFNGLKNGITKF